MPRMPRMPRKTIATAASCAGFMFLAAEETQETNQFQRPRVCLSFTSAESRAIPEGKLNHDGISLGQIKMSKRKHASGGNLPLHGPETNAFSSQCTFAFTLGLHSHFRPMLDLAQ